MVLQIRDIHKQYKTGDFVQKALDGVTLNLRDSEFVAILGPSGSGKTTLLNIIGGLDRYDSGDLVINGTSTRQYRDRDWDSYRNHTIGFVFQSYNLIPHQSILANVELALTISGIPRSQRRQRAPAALAQVGLGAHVAQANLTSSRAARCSACAIARALVNDPDIALWPTNRPARSIQRRPAVQIMDLLARWPGTVWSSWSRTTRIWPSSTPRASSTCATAASSTTPTPYGHRRGGARSRRAPDHGARRRWAFGTARGLGASTTSEPRWRAPRSPPSPVLSASLASR
ncbi:MAG: ATP-binding cassette domain-containing protein [Bifidobacterium pullorum]